jgi:hypothetical protein
MRPLILAAAAFLAGCGLISGDFRLAGSVDVSARLRDKTPKENVMLFVIAENAGGVPVAVHRIVNPEFPASFVMGPADLLVPSLGWRERLKIHAEMNTHGDVGTPRPGDLTGDAAETARSGDAGLRLVLDRVR